MGRDWGPLALITQLGLTMVGSILFGLLLGLWIDAHFGTRPWATLVLSLLGIAAGSFGVYRLISATIEESVEQRHAQHRDNSRED
ncbi:MAG TPA: AtpZ/AtpI family protein [Chloroflexota bacterium]|nr:AtpZ/AtpI family protein [Chloroflexota bacterium]